MTERDQDTVRRLLTAALDKLDKESHVDKESSNSILLSEDGADASVIVVLVSGSKAQDANAARLPVAGTTARQGIETSAALSVDRQQGRQIAHPGLERFQLTVTDPVPPAAAPKACFMEPGRTCVNSGACEMRGF